MSSSDTSSTSWCRLGCLGPQRASRPPLGTSPAYPRPRTVRIRAVPDASTSPLALADTPGTATGVDTAARQLRPDRGRVNRRIRRWCRPPRRKPTPVVPGHPERSRAGGAVALWRSRRRRGAGAATGTTVRVRRGVRPRATRHHPRSGRRHGRRAGAQPPRTARTTSRRTRRPVRASSWTTRPPTPAPARRSPNTTARALSL